MANGRGVRPTVCKQCGALALDGAYISFRALCSDCARENMTANTEQINARSGPRFDRWLDRMREGLDDLAQHG